MIENIGAYSQVDYDRGYEQGRADERPKAFSKGYDSGYEKGRADKESELKPLLEGIKFALEDYSIRLGNYAKVIDEKLKEQKNE